MFLYLCLIWDLGGGVPKVCLSTRGGEVVQNRGFRFRSSPPSGMREGGSGGGGRDYAPTHPEVRTDGEGRGGGEKEEDALSVRPIPPPMQRGIGPPIAVGGASGGIQTRPDNMEIHTV